MSSKLLDLTVADLASSRPEKIGGNVLARIVRQIVARLEVDVTDDERTLRDLVQEAAALGHRDAMAVYRGDQVGAEPPRERQKR
jgi:hypothetical protein